MKKVKTLTIILIIVLLTMIAFFGIYTQVQNRMENQVKDYELAMDLKGTRNIRLKVNNTSKEVIRDAEGNIVETEETLTDEELTEKGYIKEQQPLNKEEVLNIENYQKTKEIIEKRLKKLNVPYYEIAVEEKTGDIIIQLPEEGQIDNIVSNINSVGKFEIVDSKTKEVLIDNNDIKLANVMYGSTGETGTSVYLNIEFTKEGSQKLETISNNYKKPEENAQEDTENTEETKGEENKEAEEKKIIMQIDGQEMMSTNFEEPIRTGKLQLSIGASATDNQTLQANIQKATNIANLLDNGKMPIQYDITENKYVLSDITQEQFKWVEIALAIVIALRSYLLHCKI